MTALTAFNFNENTESILIDQIQEKIDTSKCKVFGYHCLPPVGAEEPGSVYAVECLSLPREKTADYKRNKKYRNNPFVMKPLLLARPLYWSEIAKLPDLSKKDQQWVAQLAADFHGIGLSIPVFGPYGHNGNVALSLYSKGAALSEPEIQSLQMVCQQFHIQFYNMLRSSADKTVVLSEREREVLEWIVMGKSNSVIADILGISSHTVNGYMRRIFLKLDATDRVSAVLKALAKGAIC